MVRGFYASQPGRPSRVVTITSSCRATQLRGQSVTANVSWAGERPEEIAHRLSL
jgi:hypothetical protein